MLRFLYLSSCSIAGFVFVGYAAWLGFSQGSQVLPIGNEYISVDRSQVIRVLFLGWLIIPPLATLVDWGLFCRNYDLVNLEIVRHSHGLVRNIWIGMFGAMVVLFGVGVFLRA